MSLDQRLDSLADASAEEVLRWALDRFGDRFAIVTAFQAEGVVLIDMVVRAGARPRVLTIDTGRLPQPTYDLIDRVRARYGLEVEIVFPDARDVETMVRAHGPNLFYRDRALRELCCAVRKTFPLERALAGLEAWATGLRREQSETRAQTPKAQIDHRYGGIVKVSPLADWDRESVWAYVREHDVPVSELYAAGYTSIGCAPCTRPVVAGEPERAGRWWWEAEDGKECGIHALTPSERLEEELARLKAMR